MPDPDPVAEAVAEALALPDPEPQDESATPGDAHAPDPTGGRGSARMLLAILAFAGSVLLLVGLRPLLPIDETRYLTVAWEMWQGGPKLVPHLNGDLYTHKPPLLFWLMDLAWLFTGVSELAARLVAPAFGVAAVALTGLLARRLWPAAPARAGAAAMILATTGLFLAYGSLTLFDTMLTTATLAAMLALVALRRAADDRARWRATLGLGATLALGVYAKGPVILVHVAPVALLMPLWAEAATRPRPGFWYGRLGAAFGVALALVALWLVPALILGGPDYRSEVLWKQSAGRMVASFAHGRPFWWFAALLPVYLWPWAWRLESLAALAPRRILADEGGRMLAVWAGAAFVAFSAISGKQIHYLIPELPAVALLLSVGITAASPRWQRIPALLPAAVILIAAGAVAFGPASPLPAGTLGVPAIETLVAIALAATMAVAVFRIRSDLAAYALIAPFTLVAAEVLLAPTLRAGFDAARIGQALALREATGVAVVDADYQGQFGFAGRLTGPVAELASPEQASAWAAAHPGGAVLARVPLSLPTLGSYPFNEKVWTLYAAP